MAYTTIDKSNDYFNTVLYTGNGSTQSITGVGFQPEWTWIKCRSDARNHQAYDVVRGATNQIYPNLTNAEATDANTLTSFDSDGFSLGSAAAVNVSGQTLVAWNWLAGGTASSNTDGSITSSVSANTTSGFSIVKISSGTGSNATIGHGLGIAPKMVIGKRLDSADSWTCYHAGIGATKFIDLDSTNAASTSSTPWNNTAPTSSVFSVGSSGRVNASGGSHIFYCFADVKGFSKFGTYTGNGNADGPFIYTGFKPAWVLIKNTGRSNTSWTLYDNKRPGYNSDNAYLLTDASDAELSDKDVDLLSNGFKPLLSNNAVNTSGDSYIYMAFAESPFVTSTGIPATAR